MQYAETVAKEMEQNGKLWAECALLLRIKIIWAEKETVKMRSTLKCVWAWIGSYI